MLGGQFAKNFLGKDRIMRIAQIAPLWEEVPPRQYGGTERVVSYLTEQLVRMGHEVTLYASGDSCTSARLETVWPKAFRKAPPDIDPSVLTLAHLGKVFEKDERFDIVHNHIGIQALPLLASSKKASLTTIHDGFTVENVVCFNRYRHLPYITISNAQRRPDVRINYFATVYHGIPVEKFPFSASCDTANPYLAFLGRMSPEKAPHLAIAAALSSGWRLKMAAKIASHEVAYWKEQIEPYVDGDQIQYLGELDHDAKCELLAGAAAMLFPIQWKEPFGLVMIESLACGTPVIAFNNGSVPEVIKHGKSGFVVASVEEMINAINRIEAISRATCRAEAEERFSDRVMAENYLKVYRRLLAEEPAGMASRAA
jgi:glycosyltransferase involved in cell wall biosynthesis